MDVYTQDSYTFPGFLLLSSFGKFPAYGNEWGEETTGELYLGNDYGHVLFFSQLFPILFLLDDPPLWWSFNRSINPKCHVGVYLHI